MPALPLAIPLITKAGAFLKGLTGVGTLGKAAGNATAMQAFMGGSKVKGAIGGAFKGLGGSGAKAATEGTRMAGDAMFSKGIGNAIFGDMTRGQIATRLARDVAFGVLGGAMTPGDLGDKLIAGGTQAIGGGIGGLAVGRGLGKLGASETVQTIGDFVGSYGGDFAGMAVGDTMMRGKDRLLGGSGQTPYEKMSEEQQKQLVQQIRQQTLQGVGAMPGVNSQYLGLGTGFDA